MDFHSSYSRSQFWLHYKQHHPTPSPTNWGCFTREKRNKETVLFSRAKRSTFSCRFRRFGSSTPLNKTKQLFSVLSEQTISCTTSYGVAGFLPCAIRILVSRHLVHKHSCAYCFYLTHALSNGNFTVVLVEPEVIFCTHTRANPLVHHLYFHDCCHADWELKLDDTT